MRLGRVAVLALTAMVGLGFGLVVAEPWSGPTAVEAIELGDELDQARREDDAADGEIRDDDDGDPIGGNTGTGNGGTNDGRDGTRDGDTRGAKGTGTGNSGGATAATDGGGAGTNDTNGGGGVTATNGGGGVTATNGGGGNTGGGDT